MSDAVPDEQRAALDSLEPEAIHIAIGALAEGRGFSVGGGCTVAELKLALSQRLAASAEQLELMHSGRLLTESELIGHLEGHNRCVRLQVIQRVQPTEDQSSEADGSELPAPPDSDLSFPSTTTSPLHLGNSKEALDLDNNDPGFCPAPHQPMDQQLLADQESHCDPFTQSAVSSSELTAQLLHADLEIKNANASFKFVYSGEQKSNPTSLLSSHATSVLKELTVIPTATPSSQSSVNAGMQSLLEEIMANPSLMDSLLSGPHVSSLLHCLSQYPDLGAQILPSHPFLTGNPLLQQQMRQQLSLFLQQMQSPELLLSMFSPKAMKALLQIQQGLQTLAEEAPFLIPVASYDSTDADVAVDNQSGRSPPAVSVTEQQQQFVHQMLQSLANIQISQEEEDL
ncbi:ubiquilin-1 isoform X1 [Oryzias latipes]|uniref:ubiquilin-1 isoform X1 n=1 Tax=Oryzias latipes TaxID=8090 RepID=UPI0009D91AD4|nr:ubiquilin-1 isoform X1 [Oryzias latipes]